jgi:hypothetical protein
LTGYVGDTHPTEVAMSLDSAVFLIVEVLFLVGVVVALYTRFGSGINERPYGKIYGGAPGARGPSDLSGHDPLASETDYSRGAR